MASCEILLPGGEAAEIRYLLFRETRMEAFPSPALRCNAANPFANPCDLPEALRKC